MDELVIPYIESSGKTKSRSNQQKMQLVIEVEDEETSACSIVFTDAGNKADIVAPPSGFEGVSLRFTPESDDKYKRAGFFARIEEDPGRL